MGKIENQIEKKTQRLKPLKSDLLKELLIRVNWLDFNIDLPTLSYKSGDAYKGEMNRNRYSSFETPVDIWTDFARQDLMKATENLPEELQSHIWGTDISELVSSITKSDPDLNMLEVWQQTKEGIERYESYQLLRHQFFLISTIADNFSSTNFSRSSISIPISTNPKFVVNEKGFVTLILDEFSKAVSEDKIDVRYIKRCKHNKCQIYFWAGKTNQKCCSSICNNRVNALESIKKIKEERETDPFEFNRKRKEEKERRETLKLRKISK